MNENKNIVLMGDKINEFTPKNFTFFTKPTYYDMSELKLEGLKKFAHSMGEAQSRQILRKILWDRIS